MRNPKNFSKKLRILFFGLSASFLLFGNNQSLADIKDNIIGAPTSSYKIKKADNLYKIARENNLSIAEIIKANPKISDKNLIYYNREITLPTWFIIPNYERRGIIINLAEPRLYYFKNDQPEIITFPVAIGKEGFETPLGKAYIANKRENPTWIPTPRLREENPDLPEIVKPGSDNPLGNYALDLSWPSFLIHGTNDPMSIGNPESHGCIRLYPEDIKSLFALVETYTPVRIVNQPIKIGKFEDKIYIEADLSEKELTEINKSGVYQLICRYINKCESRINWKLVWQTIEENKSIPVDITANLDEKTKEQIQ